MTANDEKPCDDCQTCHCPTTWAKKKLAELTKDRDERLNVLRALAPFSASLGRLVERWDAESAAVPSVELAPEKEVYEGDALLADGYDDNDGHVATIDGLVSFRDMLQGARGRRVRVTVEVLPYLPKDGDS